MTRDGAAGTPRLDPALARFVWPAARAGDAVRALAGSAGRGSAAPELAEIADVAADLGLNAEARDLGGRLSVREQLRQTLAQGVLLVRLPSAAGGGWLALHRGRGAHADAIGPAGSGRVELTAIEDACWAGQEADADSAFAAARETLAPALPHRGRAVAAARLLLERRFERSVLAEAWLLRAPSSTLRQELGRVRAGLRAAAIGAAYLAEMLVFVAIWRSVGQRALGSAPAPISGLISEQGKLFALLTLWAALQLGAATALRRLALDAGGVVRTWLLRGALHLAPEAIRTAGVGQLLGRALDAEALDGLALGGGVEAMAGLFELLFGAGVLAMGLAPAATLGVLALALGALALTLRRQAYRHGQWSQGRRALTHDLVERMVGHRTLLVQDHPGQRAVADDRALVAYEALTRRLDRVATWIEVGLPRSFLLLSLAVMAISLAVIGGLSPTAIGARPTALIATSLGGVWLAYSGLRRLGTAAGELIGARDAWARVRPLVAADQSTRPTGSGLRTAPQTMSPVVEARALEFQYPNRPRPQLTGASLALVAGDRLLVAGPSGAGKSTLAALLTGLKQPTAGRLLLHGQEQAAVGLARWRRAIGAVPQFHDNHVFGAELLFNLLLGRRWPPRAEDVTLAESVCRELGLGPLLARMPAGLQQTVGETGWQLSHGERSRLFVARSLLQALQARVLDESFAALDPETLDQVMAAMLRRPEALLVIAHP
jgi:ATP-binding cassette subfamily B protein